MIRRVQNLFESDYILVLELIQDLLFHQFSLEKGFLIFLGYNFESHSFLSLIVKNLHYNSEGTNS
jgi:hypothetical protein